MKQFIVKKSEEGQSSLKYIQRILKGAPNSFLFKMMRKKNIVLNGKKMEGNEKVSAGDEVSFYLSDDTFNSFVAKNENPVSLEEYKESFARFGMPSVIYEDEHVIIANKPVDMLSQKSKKDDLSINEWLIGYLLFKKEINKESLQNQKPSVCNRLDRNTGGITLFGKDLYGINLFNEFLRTRNMKKFYETVVTGKITERKEITGFLSKDEKNNIVSLSEKKVNEDDSFIDTLIEPLEYLEDKDLTILRVELLTGKSHQIRASLSYIGHPILGDYKYGLKTINDTYKKKFGICFQILYAVKIVFPEIKDYPGLSSKTFFIDEPEIFDKLRK